MRAATLSRSMTNEETTTVTPVDGRDRFIFAAWLFLRLLAVIYFIAFASAWTQLDGLIGPHGLLPAQTFFAAVHQQLGDRAWLALPSLCWVFGAGKFLFVLCASGVVLSL